ncbi:hypothetical protein [Blastococcus deserti]|uniref:Secreted protein with PEP-CTERM sorting signal n=1 Tax=Blastococcus deserti TaxID=2259033 RepID=A0ABW4X4W0_9ACTN
MFLLVFAVPALLVVVVGYVAGYAVAEWFCALIGADPARTPEVAGWTTGLVLLAVLLWLAAGRWRRRGAVRRGRGHQK